MAAHTVSGDRGAPRGSSGGRAGTFARPLSWLLAACTLVAMVSGWALDQELAARSLPRQGADPATGLAFVTMAVLGAFLAHKRPDNNLGWLFLGIGTISGLSLLAPNYAYYSFHVRELPAATPVAWLSVWVWFPTIGSIMTFFFLLYPTGRVPGPRWRWVFRAAVAAIATLVVSLALKPGPLDENIPIDNPVGLEAAGPVVGLLGAIGGILFVTAALLSLGSLVVRFRRGTQIERLQIKWFAFAAAINVTTIVSEIAFPSFFASLPSFVEDTGFGLMVLLLPVTAAIAILRYRLYDIDIIINRALVYGVLTAALLAAYLGIVVALSRLLDPVTRDSQVAVAASTLTVAALFRPLRARIQGFIDRRFYRAKYDAVRALQDFSARLRDELDTDEVRADVLGVVAHTVQPAHQSLWLVGAER